MALKPPCSTSLKKGSVKLSDGVEPVKYGEPRLPIDIQTKANAKKSPQGVIPYKGLIVSIPGMLAQEQSLR